MLGDILFNVVLGFDHTVPVTMDHMILFGQCVRKGAPDKFLVVDMPFGSTNTMELALQNATSLFQQTQCQAIKIEGGHDYLLPIIQRLTEIGIPVMGHLGLTPQSVHQLGGYYTHGKKSQEHKLLLEQSLKLEKAGCFSLVLECIQEEVSADITEQLTIPTIGIGSGENVDGHVLVINDLFKMGPKNPPSFCSPILDLYDIRQKALNEYLKNIRRS